MNSKNATDAQGGLSPQDNPQSSNPGSAITESNSAPTGKTLANWIDRNALEDLATRLQRHLIALKESKS